MKRVRTSSMAGTTWIRRFSRNRKIQKQTKAVKVVPILDRTDFGKSWRLRTFSIEESLCVMAHLSAVRGEG